MKIVSSFSLFLSTLIVVDHVGRCAGCTMPTGIDDGGPINSADLTLPPDGFLWFSGFGPVFTNGPVAGPVDAIETPIRNRLNFVINAPIYSAMAMFHPTSLDIWGRKALSDSRRRCSEADGVDPELLANHRRVTLLYVASYAGQTTNPELKSLFDTQSTTWGLDNNICDVEDCSDISTPWGLAFTLAQESKLWFDNDGWNHDGSLSSTYNKIPYKDWRSNPYTPDPNCDTCWQPLEETDGLGFLYRQNHVTSHIGETGKSFFFTNEDVCARRLEDPDYDYSLEAELAITRLANLTPEQKAEIEFFDNKGNSLVPLIFQYFARLGVSFDSWEWFFNDFASVGVLYEAVLASWKEKVRLDKIRPTTWIHDNLGETPIFSYLGPTEKTAGSLPANEWQPYIRVMPHAEFPSGSSCLCSAFAASLIATTGSDNFTATIGGPLQVTIQANSSFIEEGMPTEDVVLSFNSWTEISERCGSSRLDGGMHFTASVPKGVELCEDIGVKVAAYFTNLQAGLEPEYTTDPTDLTVFESRDCPEDIPETCGLNYDVCTEDPNVCCPDYICQFQNPFYSRCITDPSAVCLPEFANCLDHENDCCFGTICVGDLYYKQCVRP